MELHSASQARLYKVFMNLGRKFDDMKQESLTPSVHKTVMQCFVSCEFFTETRIAVFTRDVQLYLISFY